MKILKKDRNGNVVKIEVETPAESVNLAKEKTLKEAAQEIKIPGFRKGKAPKAMVERAINQEYVKSRAVESLISDLYPLVIKEAEINPVDYPKISIISQIEGKPLVFSLEVEVFPEVKLGKYKGIKVSKKSTTVTDEDLNKVLGSLQDRFARFEEKKDGVVEDNDLAEIEMEAEKDGEVFEPLTKKDVKIAVGQGGISPEFDAQIKGMKIGEEKNFSITFMTDYPLPEVAGQKVTFKIKLTKISKKESIPLDDEFAKKVSPLASLAELKVQLKQNLAEEKKQAAETDLRNKLVEEIIKGARLDVPKALVNREVDIMLDEMSHNLSRSNLTLEGYLKSIRKDEPALRAELSIPAKSRVEAKVILREIAKEEKIKVEAADFEKEYSKIALESGKTLAEFKATLSDSARNFIEDYLLRQKALDFVIDSAKILENN